jgi:GAF domain-containing protein
VEPESRRRGQPSSDYSGQNRPPVDLAELLGRIARDLEAETTLEQTMQALVTAAVAAIPGADEGGITEVRHRGSVNVRFASDDLVVDLDTAQEELGEGPCLDAAYQHRTVRVDDFADEPRWRAFAARAGASGVGSMLSIQLYVQGDDLGALNMYARAARAFDDESEQVGLLFATHAAIAMAGARREHQLRVAISSRDVIGQAKGILMERYKVTPDQAFAVLTRASSESNLKLREVAEKLAGSGEVPQR